MTRPPGGEDPRQGSRRRSYTAHSTGSIDGSLSGHRQPHTVALERRMDKVIDVGDARRLVECAQIERQLQFQHLVRRYMSQILYGCTSAYCTTPTCLSCNKRLVTRPFRAPTQLTARALAHFLASQDNPHHGLCPHQLKVAPGSLEIEGASGADIRHGQRGFGRLYNVFPARLARSQSQPVNASSIVMRTVTASTGDDAEEVMDYIRKRHQTRKDMKSLGQNLYDTVTVIYSYSKQIPNPLSVFALLRSSNHQDLEALRITSKHETITASNTETRLDSSDASFDSHANGHPVPPNVNDIRTLYTAPHNEQDDSTTPPRSNAMPATFEVLSDGQRLHRIRHSLERRRNGQTDLKSPVPTLFDGTADLATTKKPTTKASIPVAAHRPSRTVPAPLSHSSIRHDHPGNEPSRKYALLPVTSHLDCDIMEQLKEEVYHHRDDQSSDFNFSLDFEPNRRFRPAKPFVNRSIFFSLSDPELLLRSFRDENNVAYKDSPLPHLNSTRMTYAFGDWNRRNGALIFDSLWRALEALFRPPPELDVQKSPRLKPSRKNSESNGTSGTQPRMDDSSATTGRYLNNDEAAHIIMICIHALTSSVPFGWPHTWVQLRKFRSWGIIVPDAPPHMDFTSSFVDPWLNIIDELEYEPAIRLADRLARAIGARLCFEHILASIGRGEARTSDPEKQPKGSSLISILVEHLCVVEKLALVSKRKMKANLEYDEDPGWTVTATFIEWLRTIIIKKWDGKAEVNKWTSVGTAFTIFKTFHDNRGKLRLRSSMFHLPYLNERLDPVNEPVNFLNWVDRPNSFHLFQYPCLFPQDYLIAYFRTINFTSMFKQYERTERTTQLQRDLDPFLREPYWISIRRQLSVTLSDYFVLDIRRNHALIDTLDHLWGQEKRLILKPLKVKMGMQEGEVGLDQGGVTYEFFRVVLSEAFDPGNGMFTEDPQTRMMWFQPASLEPEWKFEMLGVLFSLAIYNGITLPVTFPKSFYHGLLRSDTPQPGTHPRTTDFIRDGWPMIASSLDALLHYDQGDVRDDIMRAYCFSFEAYGQNIDVDMRAFNDKDGESILWPADYDESVEAANDGPFGATWPSNRRRPALDSPAWARTRESLDEIPLVSNANREDFVKDYIFWLTVKSVAPQLTAFRKGFRTCLHPKSLDFFDASSLKALVEGVQEISASALKAATRYEDGYSATHCTIVDFWDIVDNYSQDDKRRLLEFVTASERVPVTGFENMNFVIVRMCSDTDMLPTSSTCFGKLLLPEYQTKEKMRGKLALAIQNSKGFGVV